jgi:hypothetical protein
MGFRFRKRPRLLPGVRLNISKSGFSSISAGVRGFTVNIGRKGTRTTVGVPGSGLSYTTRLSRHAPGAEVRWQIVLAVVLALAFVFWVLKQA